MTITEHEATLAAARTMLLTGPFWVLDLWHALPPHVQLELVAVLAERESFRDALATHGLYDDFNHQLEDWLDELGVAREEVDSRPSSSRPTNNGRRRDNARGDSRGQPPAPAGQPRGGS